MAALLLTARTAGRAGVRELMVRLTSWRVNWKWWAAPGFSTKHGSAFSRAVSRPETFILSKLKVSGLFPRSASHGVVAVHVPERVTLQ
jgi:hypothetical protein